MKVTAKQTVIRLHCWFEADEVTALRAIGQLPPDCAIPAPMWLTTEELVATLRMLYGDAAVKDMMDMLAQQIERFS
jgi:hypothetical protein